MWKIAHRFACGENLYGVRVSDNLVLPVKKAWDYLWVSHGYDQTNTGRFPKPTGAYVEKVYQEADFTLIGLGR